MDLLVFGGTIYAFHVLASLTNHTMKGITAVEAKAVTPIAHSKTSIPVVRNTNNNNVNDNKDDPKIQSPDKQDKDDDAASSQLRQALADGTSRDAKERICTVDRDNKPTPKGNLRSEMRLQNLWHRATYMVIRHEERDSSHDKSSHKSASNDQSKILVQRRSLDKDYCPGKLDPFPGGVVGYDEAYEENAVRELEEEMGIDALLLSDDHKMDRRISAMNQQHHHHHELNNRNATHTKATIQRLFTFPFQDARVKVWGELFEVLYHGSMDDIHIQEAEVAEVVSMTLLEVEEHMARAPADWMPDAVHAFGLWRQHSHDRRVLRRLESSQSSSLSLDAYRLRSKPKVIFFDCDDCLYFDGWKVANQITQRIDTVCTKMGLPSGEAYELYKRHGTALKGLLEEGWMDNHSDNNDAAVDEYLRDVHDVNYDTIQPDPKLRAMLLAMDPTIPKYIFTASVKDHAERCLAALGIRDCFHETIIDTKACGLETKHSPKAFEVAMKVAAGIDIDNNNIDNIDNNIENNTPLDPESCLFLDDSVKNIVAAQTVGWRCVLVGRVGRDCGTTHIQCDHAEHDIDIIHDFPNVFPELFIQ
jgi:pyrimidine 5'-nucleotidase